MRVALYHPWTYLQSGIERIFVEVFRRSRHSWTLFTHHFDPSGTYPELSDADVVELAPRVSVRRSFRPLLHAARTIASSRLPSGYASLLVSSEGLGDLILLRNRMPAACYCHTPLKILHDPATRAGLRRRDPAKHLALAALGPPFAAVDRALWRRYRHVLVSSEEVRRRAERAGLRPAGRFEILPPGVDLEWFSDDGGAREDFFLVAGRIKWWKNIELAIDAVAAARARGLAARMVIAGAADRLDAAYLSRLRARAEGLPIEFDTEPSQQRLRDLYRRCRALVLPSLNEDFGMVALEAMACGAPVIAVDSGGPRETVLDGRTGWLVPPTPEDFVRAMTRASSSEALRMRAAARARAEQFTWSQFVARLDEVMEEVASEGAGGAQRGR